MIERLSRLEDLIFDGETACVEPDCSIYFDRSAGKQLSTAGDVDRMNGDGSKAELGCFKTGTSKISVAGVNAELCVIDHRRDV